MENNSIEMKIAKTAAQNWGQQVPATIEEAKGITYYCYKNHMKVQMHGHLHDDT